MTDESERRAEIIREGYATLARTAGVTVEHRDHSDEDALSKWRRNMPTEKPVRLADVEQRIAEERAIWREVSKQTLVHERQLHRAEVSKLRKELDELTDCFRALLKATDKLERSLAVDGDWSAKVIELPALPRSRRG